MADAKDLHANGLVLWDIYTALESSGARSIHRPVWKSSHPPIPTAATQIIVPSSPIRTSTDPQIILEQFFDWLLLQPGNESEREREILQRVKKQLVEDEWEVDTLRERRDGKGMTETTWVESYGFKIGTLVMIRSRISEFKNARPQSQGSSSNSIIT
jgi:hypothetical protein